ncbi:MAG: CvpA family protein [Fusobacteriales bacterium]|nr:MAG: CvpA family protein [Fusobacteriales bacterium]
MYLDILILVILVLALLSGIRNGIFTEIISVFGFIMNIVIAKTYTPLVLKYLEKIDTVFNNNYLVTYIVTFVAVYLIISIILALVKKVLRKQRMGFLNRALGGILGLVKGGIVALILILIYTYSLNFAPSLEKYSDESKSIQIFYEIIPNFENYVPDALLEKFNKNATKKFIEKNLIDI